MAIQLGAKNAADLAGGVWSTWFFYGDSGSAKTTLASSFPRPIFIVPNTENSIETLRGFEFPYFTCTSAKTAESDPLVNGAGSMDAIVSHLEMVYKSDPNNCPFDTVVSESISHYQDYLIQDLSKEGQLIMDQSKWGLFANRLMAMHVRLKSMEVHVVYTALAKLEKVDDKTLHGGPLISGAPATKLPAACTTVGYCETYAGDTRRVHFKKHMHWHARSRFSKLPAMYKGGIQDFKNFYPNIEKYLVPDDA